LPASATDSWQTNPEERDHKREKDNPEERDHKRELEILNGLLLNETESFFQRILDSQMSAFISSSKNNEDKQIK